MNPQMGERSLQEWTQKSMFQARLQYLSAKVDSIDDENDAVTLQGHHSVP